MRELFYGQAGLLTESGAALHCIYQILIRTTPPPLCCESYGVRVLVAETGERAEIFDITVCAERIEALAALLLRGQVTPCALSDVVADWL